MINPKFKLDNNSPTVSWADPKNADSSASSQVLLSQVSFDFHPSEFLLVLLPRIDAYYS